MNVGHLLMQDYEKLQKLCSLLNGFVCADKFDENLHSSMHSDVNKDKPSSLK